MKKNQIKKEKHFKKDEYFFKEKVTTIKIIMLIMGMVILGFAFLRLIQENYLQGFFDLFLFFSIAIGYLILRKNKHHLVVISRVLIVVASITSIAVILLLPDVETRFSWVVICVYMMFFLLDFKEGLIWIVSLLGIITLLFFLDMLFLDFSEFAIFFISISVLTILLSRYEKIKQKSELHFINYNAELEKAVLLKTKELNKLNTNLENMVSQELEKNRQKDLQMLESAKMASLGEMIGNIAHQWRQPLSAISMLASKTELQKQLNTLDLDELSDNMKNIISKTEYLSETIDTFRDFIKEKKEKKEVILQERIDVALGVISVVLLDKNIKLQNNIIYDKPINMTLVVGELEQVIINIINNAKDALIENNISDPIVTISMEQTNKEITIVISDNGGGIPNGVVDKIFDPYFTTKHQSQGTGLGLHMSYKIIKESFHGSLFVKNINHGASFFINFPIVK